MLEHFPTTAPRPRPLTKVYAIVTGIPRRHRAYKTLSLEVATLDGHQSLDGAALASYESAAWARIDAEKLRGVSPTALLSVFKAQDYGGGLESVNLAPHQQSVIKREV